MDVSKAFDSIPHDLIAKMYAYGVSKNSLELFCTKIKTRKTKR